MTAPVRLPVRSADEQHLILLLAKDPSTWELLPLYQKYILYTSTFDISEVVDEEQIREFELEFERRHDVKLGIDERSFIERAAHSLKQFAGLVPEVEEQEDEQEEKIEL